MVNRPVSHFLGKLLIPLMVVILAALSALMLKASNFDTRLALTGTGLLTLIFLQQGYSADLPNPVPFVLMDKIYALAYGAVLVTFFRVIWTTDRVHRKEHDEMRSSRVIASWPPSSSPPSLRERRYLSSSPSPEDYAATTVTMTARSQHTLRTRCHA